VWVIDSGGAHSSIVVTDPNSPTGYTQAGYYEPGVSWNNNTLNAFYGPGKNDVGPASRPCDGVELSTTPAQDAAILAAAQAIAANPGNYMVIGIIVRMLHVRNYRQEFRDFLADTLLTLQAL
jgi:hypothetical protein